MASSSQRKATRISQKLTLLKDQGDRLLGAVSQYVSEITAAGESWLEGGDKNMEYLDLYQTIDSAVEFLWDRCEELADASAGVSTNQLSWPSREQSDPIPLPTTATSYRQPTTSQTSTGTTFNRQPTEIVHSADKFQLKPALARIAVIEEALCSLQGNAENVAEKQNDIDQQLTEVLIKLSDSDKKNNSRFRKVKEQISEISDRQDALNQEHEARLQSLEKQVKKLNATQDTIKVEMQSHEELTERLVHLPDQLESVKENLDVLKARICKIIDDCSNKHQEMEKLTFDLEDKLVACTESAQLISEDHKQKTTLLRELETRLKTIETGSERNVKDVQKQVEKGEANFRILCQMLNDRLTPLEQLRTCLNQRASTRDENVKMLPTLIQEIAGMSPRLQQLELASSRTRCGFTAKTWLSDDAEVTIRPYTILYGNVGGNFDPKSGIFTAPVDGLYVAFISLYHGEGGEMKFGVKYQKQSSIGSDYLLSTSSASVKDTTACSVSVVDMKAGDILFSYLRNIVMYDPYDLSVDPSEVDFSCFLLA